MKNKIGILENDIYIFPIVNIVIFVKLGNGPEVFEPHRSSTVYQFYLLSAKYSFDD